MASEPTTIRMSAWRSRSELTTAPIVVRLACDSIFPRSLSRAMTISPSLPSVGNRVLPTGPAAGDADGEAEAPGDAEADGAGVGEADGDAERRQADGAARRRGGGRRATADGPGEALGFAEPDGDADGVGGPARPATRSARS